MSGCEQLIIALQPTVPLYALLILAPAQSFVSTQNIYSNSRLAIAYVQWLKNPRLLRLSNISETTLSEAYDFACRLLRDGPHSVADLNQLERITHSNSSLHLQVRDLPLIILGVALHSYKQGIFADKNIESIDQVPSDPVEQRLDPAFYLDLFGSALRARFERTGSMEYLNVAIAALQTAVIVAFSDNPRYLGNLGAMLWIRYQATSSHQDLDGAFDAMLDAVNSMEPSNITYLRNLLSIASVQADVTKSLETLNKAIAYLQDCLGTKSGNTGVPISLSILDPQTSSIPEPFPSRALTNPRLKGSLLVTLARLHLRRYTITGKQEDLDAAICICETRENEVSGGPVSAFMLGHALQTRFNRNGARKDLNRAIAAFDLAARLTPLGRPDRSTYVCANINALISRFERRGMMEDILKAIEVAEAAISSLPVANPSRARLFFCLAKARHQLFDRTRIVEHLDGAIGALEDALYVTDPDDPFFSEQSILLGDALKDRFVLDSWSPDIADLTRAICSYEQAAHNKFAPPTTRIIAAWRAGRALEFRDVKRANGLLKLAVELLPTTSPRTLNRIHQQATLSEFSGLAGTAAAMSRTAQETVFEGLRLLELGRGIIAGLHLNLQRDLDNLNQTDPELGERFKQLRDELDSPVSVDKYSIWNDTSKLSTRRRTLSMELDINLRKIYDIQGFSNFMREPSEVEVMSLARHGPIVVFNVARTRSDAFLITKDRLTSLLLPGLHFVLLQAKTRELMAGLDALDDAGYEMMKDMLQWLWDVAVGPVLDELGFRGPPEPGEVWPRVWWVASGWLNLLPIHAAGYHSKGSSRNALDRVVSSYTPTLKSLAFSRQSAVANSTRTRQKVLLIGMSETPDQNPLPSVVEEIRCLDRVIPTHTPRTILQTPGNPPTKAQVLTELADCQIVHFACHGQSMVSDPSESRLYLQDWQDNPFTVTDITQCTLKRPQLAYLSACQSSSNRVVDLLDEGIHLAGACQLAGFPFVIGTLWQILDTHSADLAGGIFMSMVEGDRIHVSRSAQSLHDAVRRLRDATRVSRFGRELPDNPLIWAPYIHVGA